MAISPTILVLICRLPLILLHLYISRTCFYQFKQNPMTRECVKSQSCNRQPVHLGTKPFSDLSFGWALRNWSRLRVVVGENLRANLRVFVLRLFFPALLHIFTKNGSLSYITTQYYAKIDREHKFKNPTLKFVATIHTIPYIHTRTQE